MTQEGECTGAGRGPDRPRLVLLHGGSGRHQWFDGLRRLLPNDWKVYAPDLPGHGGVTASDYSLRATASWLIGVLHNLDDGPWVLFGHSHGGHVALLVASEAPDLVCGVVLGDVPLDMDRLRSHVTASEPMTRAWAELAAMGLSPSEITARLEQVLGPEGGGQVTGDASSGYLTELGHSLAGHDPKFLTDLLDRFEVMFDGFDPERCLRRLRSPVLALQSDPEAGGLMTDDDVELARQVTGGLTHRRLSGVGHGLQLQNPGAVASALSAWMRAQHGRG